MKHLKLLQCMLLSVFILSVEAQKANAFFLMPPMPWDIEVDIPGNANKVVSNVKAVYRKLQTIISEGNSQKLEILKQGEKFLKERHKAYEDKENKAPGKGKIVASSELGISDGRDETENYNAFFRLFLKYPKESEYEGNYAVVKTAYRNKSKEYVEDMVMETYLTGRMTEDYLSIVEKTLTRLEDCHNGVYTKEEMDIKCVFFGLKMAYIENIEDLSKVEDSPEESENAGHYGVELNSYIVSVVYDRLLRIVEDMTAMEAQFRSAMQIEMVDPLEEKEESNAAEYTVKQYDFAYNEVKDYAYAKSYMGSGYKRSDVCKNGGKDCPEYNKEAAIIPEMEDTEVLQKLKPIDEELRKAVNIHNLKSRLPEYKTQYRKFLKSLEVHKRLRDVLNKSDQCVMNFFDKYKTTNINWGSVQGIKEYDNLPNGSISKELILAYQADTTDKIIGTDGKDCSGFYESCPAGYKKVCTPPEDERDIKIKCPEGEDCETRWSCPYDSALCRCVLDTVTGDTETIDGRTGSPKIDYDADVLPEAGFEAEGRKNTRDYNDTDYLTDSTTANNVETENRVKAEKSWRLGYDKMMELTESGALKFKPWTDQKNLQTEYMRNKYRNIRMITETVDQGMMSYRVGRKIADKYKVIGPIEEMLPAISRCKLAAEATKDAYNKDCGDYTIGKTCSINGDNGACSGQRMDQAIWEVTVCVAYNEEGSCTAYGKETRTADVLVNCRSNGTNGKQYINTVREYCKPGLEPGACITVENITHDQGVYTPTSGCEFTKAPTQYSDIEAGDECPGLWDFSIKFFVNKFFPGVLASLNPERGFDACPGGLDPETKHLYNTTNKQGRVIASDKLEEVIKVRRQEEEKQKKMVEEYYRDISKLQTEYENLKTSRVNMNKSLSSSTDKKNNAIEERKRSERQVKALKSRIEDLEKNRLPVIDEILANKKTKGTGLKKDKEENIPEVIKKMKDEIAYIESGSASGGNSFYKEETPKEDIFYSYPDLDKQITSLNGTIKGLEAQLDSLQERITSKEKEITARAEKFAEDYVNVLGNSQKLIEDANKDFEQFLELQGDQEAKRMRGPKYCSKKFGPVCLDHSNEYSYDNLESTMQNIMFAIGNKGGINSSATEGLVLKQIKKRWIEGKDAVYISKLEAAGIKKKFYIANGSWGQYGVGVGTHTTSSIYNALKGYVPPKATNVLGAAKNGIIQQGDQIIDDEVEAAKNKVKAVMDFWQINGDEELLPLKADNDKINIHTNYDEGGIAASTHQKLIADLQQAVHPAELSDAGIILKESFGIPEDTGIDDEYFVALPARGNFEDINTVPTFGKDNNKLMLPDDKDAGRDYRSPHRPLLNLPPLREVFYYSIQDYEDTPKKGDKPSIPYLIDLKYKGTNYAVEYIPEVWRYLLATPNNRADGKYHQTFVERAYHFNKIKDHLENKPQGGNSNKYKIIVSRSGVYPCRLGGSSIDISDSMNGAPFKRGGAGNVLCQDIGNYKNGVQHLLADFEPKTGGKAVQKSLGGQNEPMFENYSELGQLLNGNLGYRETIKNVSESLLNDKDKNTENSLARQVKDLTTYKRNLIGTFLDAVNAEHNAEKVVENSRESVMNALKGLCQQFNSFKDDQGNAMMLAAAGDNYSDEACAEEIIDEALTNNRGLASSSDDDEYDANCGASSGNFYATVFCELDRMKDAALNEAKQQKAILDAELAKMDALFPGYAEKVKERTDEIRNYIEALEADSEEISNIQPGATAASVKEELKTAEQNREASEIAAAEGILSMDNQGRAVAYCPVY